MAILGRIARAAMIYVVEVENGEGKKATKEYDALTRMDLREMIARDLHPYPNIRIVDVWPKGQRDGRIFADRR
jgi:hypothetical protein